jgi:hypothetical protein
MTPRERQEALRDVRLLGWTYGSIANTLDLAARLLREGKPIAAYPLRHDGAILRVLPVREQKTIAL